MVFVETATNTKILIYPQTEQSLQKTRLELFTNQNFRSGAGDF
jgi:hypothetical protein